VGRDLPTWACLAEKAKPGLGPYGLATRFASLSMIIQTRSSGKIPKIFKLFAVRSHQYPYPPQDWGKERVIEENKRK